MARGCRPVSLRRSLPAFSRIVLLPVIAGISYEVIRFSGAHRANAVVKLIMAPSLMLQAMTTRPPDDDQIEVAIAAMQTAIAADQGTAPSTDSGQSFAYEGLDPLPTDAEDGGG